MCELSLWTQFGEFCPLSPLNRETVGRNGEGHATSGEHEKNEDLDIESDSEQQKVYE